MIATVIPLRFTSDATAVTLFKEHEITNVLALG